MAFLYRKGKTGPIETKIVANSEVLQIGEAVRIDNDGFVISVPLGEHIYGVVQGVCGPYGEVLRSNGAGGDYDPHGSFTFASDNETVAKNKVQIYTSKEAIYSVTADAAFGTTTGSGLAGYTMDNLSGALSLDESSALATTGQWKSHGLDPEDSTNRVLVSIFEHQLDA